MKKHELQIPAPYNQYYEFSPNEVNFDELPDAFDHYKDLKVIAELYAKEQYEDALADNCLDFCWLVSDNGRLMLVTTAGLRVYPITLEEIQDCVGDGSHDNWNEDYLEESVEMFGRAKRKNNSTAMHESVESTINDYKKSRDIDIDTALACNRSIQVGNSRAPVDTIYIQFQSRFEKYPSLVGYAHLDNGGYDHEYLSATDIRNYDLSRYMNGTDITDLEGMLRDNPSILFESTAIDLSEAHEYNDHYDDYEESLLEDNEMSDAQRLALQELDDALEVGEVTEEEHDAGRNVQWDINFEDVVLFISGIDISLKDIKHVAYGDCDETKFDGCYAVTLHNGEVRKYGWHDFDMTGSLYPIVVQQESCLNEDAFNPGDHVYVSVANRRGRVRKMITPDLVEVELDGNCVYPARIDRYYTSSVELLGGDNDLDDDFMLTESTNDAVDKYLRPSAALQEFLNSTPETVTYPVISKAMEEFFIQLDKFPKGMAGMSMDLEYDKAIFYKKYLPLAKKCKEIIKSDLFKVSGYGRLDAIKLKIKDQAKAVDNYFPYGWSYSYADPYAADTFGTALLK